jgi:flagellar biosynthesis/type III secretory pathway chaperone
MTKSKDLEEILRTEADLAEALAGVMVQKQRSIVEFDAEQLGALTQREQDLMAPFRDLEKERVRVAAELASGLPGQAQTAQEGHIQIRDLVNALEGPAGDSISGQAARLRHAVERILNVNQQNRILMQHSLRFVRETLRLVTNDHTRQLVDQRM